MICLGCGTLAPDGQSMCADCGRALPVIRVEPNPVPKVWGCTCGGGGICTACVLAEYEGDIAR